MSRYRRGSTQSGTLDKFWDKCKKPFRRDRSPHKNAIGALLGAAALLQRVPGGDSLPEFEDQHQTPAMGVSPIPSPLQRSSSIQPSLPPASYPRGHPLNPPGTKALAAPAVSGHLIQPPTQSPPSLPTNSRTLVSLWEKAINSLNDEDRESLAQLGKHDTFMDALKETRNAQQICISKQWKFVWKGETIVARNVVDKIAGWIDKYGGVIDSFVQLDPLHAAIPWAGFKVVLQICVSDSQTMGANLVGLEVISNLMGRCAIYEQMYLQNGNAPVGGLEKALIELYASILLYFVQVKKYFTKNTAGRILSSAIVTNEIQELLDDIIAKENSVLKEKDIEEAKYRRLIDLGLENKISDESKKLKRLLKEFETPISDILAYVKDLYDAEQDIERGNILRWLSEVQYSRHHNDASEGRVGCEWLFKKDQFCQWKTMEKSSMLWLRGIPGSGKTKLTSAVVDSILREPGFLGGNEALAYFYCRRDEAADPSEIMRTIILQLSLRVGLPLPQPLIDIYKVKKAQNFTSGPLNLAESGELLLLLLEKYSHTTIIIDALDECDEGRRQKFIPALKRIIDFSASPVKIFLSSRNDDDIIYILNRESIPNIIIRPKDNYRDIKRFVDAEVNNCINSGKLLRGKVSDVLKRTVKHKIVDEAHGMFLWADLQIKEMCELLLEFDIRERLGKLPATLEKAYHEIYERIQLEKGRGPELAKKTLMWLLCSCRPLSPSELLAMISSPGVSINEDELLKLFRNLLVVDRTQNIVRFMHLSVREFFEKIFDTVTMNSMAAEFCLSLLNSKRRWISKEPTSPKELTPSKKLTPIQEYVVIYWPNHLDLCLNQQMDPEIPKLLQRFLGTLTRPSKAYSDWFERAGTTLETMWYLDVRRNLLAREFKHIRARGITPILAACVFGFGEKIKSLWEEELDANYKNRRGESLLYLASGRGYDWIVEVLLRRGAKTAVRRDSNHDETPLYAAILNGHEKVVKLLLNKEGNLNTRYGRYGSALHVAVVKGHEGVVRMLIDKGAEVNSQCVRYGSPLHAAVFKGHERIVELLLEEGADLNSKSGSYESALHAAVLHGRERVVESLLEKGADLNASFGEYGTALQAAAHRGRRKTVELLLEKGVDINELAGKYGTALQAAASGRHVKIAKILLQHKADVNLEGGKHGDALWAALNSGQPKIVQMLLDTGAKFNDVNGRYGNPLSAAATNGHQEVVQVLLDFGIDANVQGGDYGNPLSAACARGRREAATALVKKGARVNAEGGIYGNALLAASTSGWATVVDYLLQNGADVNNYDLRHGNALYAAAVNGHEKVIKRLLRAGARLDVKGGEHGYALSAAANGGYLNVVDTLLEAGADVNAHGGRYGNALIAAKRHGHQKVVRILRRRGAILDSEKLRSLLPNLLENASEPESDESCAEETEDEKPQRLETSNLKRLTAFDSEKIEKIRELGNESETDSDESAIEGISNEMRKQRQLQRKKIREHKEVVKILQDKRIPINPENPTDMWDESDYESDDEFDAEKPNDDSDVEDEPELGSDGMDYELAI